MTDKDGVGEVPNCCIEGCPYSHEECSRLSVNHSLLKTKDREKVPRLPEATTRRRHRLTSVTATISGGEETLTHGEILINGVSVISVYESTLLVVSPCIAKDLTWWLNWCKALASCMEDCAFESWLS